MNKNKEYSIDWPSYAKKFRKKALGAGYNSDEIKTCLQYARNLSKQNLPIIYDAKHFSNIVEYESWYIHGVTNSKTHFYRKYKIPKKNGEYRNITEPLPSLKEIQRWILDNILTEISIHPAAKAYSQGLSIVDNARFHKKQKLVLRLDIKDFFPSIRINYVNSIFKEIGYSKSVSKLLAELTTYNGSLPQGAPTSPMLSNIIMRRLDARVFSYARKKELRYTRYADDLIISGDFNPAEVISFLKMVIKETGFCVNTKKTRILRQSNRQIVTGVVVNKKLQAPKDVRRKIRQELYYIKKFGLDSHMTKCDMNRANYIPYLKGLAHYVLQVNSKDRDALALIEYFREQDSQYL